MGLKRLTVFAAAFVGVLLVAACLRTPAMAQFALARYNPNGSLDPTFGSNGTVVTSFPPAAGGTATSLARDPATGKLVVAGSVWGANGWQWALARYNPNGSLDPTFGSGGRVLTPFGGTFDPYVSLAADWATGKLVAAGAVQGADGSQFALARYNPDGSLDPTFGSGGIVLTPFPTTYGAEAHTLAVTAR